MIQPSGGEKGVGSRAGPLQLATVVSGRRVCKRESG